MSGLFVPSNVNLGTFTVNIGGTAPTAQLVEPMVDFVNSPSNDDPFYVVVRYRDVDPFDAVDYGSLDISDIRVLHAHPPTTRAVLAADEERSRRRSTAP